MNEKKYSSPSADIVRFDTEEVLLNFLQLSIDNTLGEISLDWK